MKKRSIMALGAGVSWLALQPTLAMAQEAPASAPAQAEPTADPADPDQDQEIIVQGIRQSLAGAQQIKRNSDVFVDAVTASDISALPDKSVTEALQRIPGVSISRFASFTDSDHFTVEGAGAVVRGLDNTRSEINGRDVFSASGAQGISWNAISPELIGSIEVYKNQSADMIEGGIAGTINLGIRKPFDFPDQRIAINLQADYGDMIDRVTPTVSGLYSNRWSTGAGEFGLLVGGVYSELKSRSQASGSRRWLEITDPTSGADVWMTKEANIRQSDYQRVRDSQTAALQWRSDDGKLDATFQFFRASYENSWDESTLETDTGVNTDIRPAPGTAWEFGDNGVFERGILTLPNQGSRGPGQYGAFPLEGFPLTNATRGAYDHNVTTDYGFKLRWSPTERLHVDFDAQYVKSKRSVVDFTLGTQTYANADLDFSGSLPKVKFLAPPDAAIQGPDYFASLSSWYPAWAMDHLEDYEAESFSVRADAKYDVSDDGWLRAVRFGARRTDRDQQLRNSTYNWGFLSQSWSGGGQVPLSRTDIVPAGLYTVGNLDDLLRQSASNTGLDKGYAVWAGPSLGRDYAAGAKAVYDLATALAAAGTGASWRPMAMRDGVVAGTPYLPSESSTVDENSTAFYARADFESPSGRLVGNIGVRYVRTAASTAGALAFPDGDELRRNSAGTVQSIADYCSAQAGASSGLTIGNIPAPCIPDFVITNQATGAGGFANGYGKTEGFFRWADGSAIATNVKHTYARWLPSLNMKYELNRETILRLGLSRAMSRPNFSDLSSAYNFGPGQLFQESRTWSGPTATGGNVALNPMMSDQIDFAVEWYFGKSSSLTGTVFYKRLTDTIVNQFVSSPFTNNGETYNVRLDSKGNQGSAASVKGFEIAYQQTFEKLPGLLSGLGVQANYTYLSTDASPVLAVNLDDAGIVVPVDVSPLSRQGLSTHTANLVGFYDRNGLTIRAAYNWRSKYLLDPRDSGEPYFPIRSDAAGYLDASISYAITSSVRLGVEGTNLLNTKNRTNNLVNDDFLETPRNLTIADRRFAVYLRGNF